MILSKIKCVERFYSQIVTYVNIVQVGICCVVLYMSKTKIYFIIKQCIASDDPVNSFRGPAVGTVGAR